MGHGFHSEIIGGSEIILPNMVETTKMKLQLGTASDSAQHRPGENIKTISIWNHDMTHCHLATMFTCNISMTGL